MKTMADGKEDTRSRTPSIGIVVHIPCARMRLDCSEMASLLLELPFHVNEAPFAPSRDVSRYLFMHVESKAKYLTHDRIQQFEPIRCACGHTPLMIHDQDKHVL